MNARVNIKCKKSKKPIIMITMQMIIVVTLIGIVVNFYGHYNHPSLVGKWISAETGKTVDFEENGIVKVDNIITGEYKITNPGLIIYKIEGRTFEMNYKIEERTLVWGLPHEEEKFERKGI